MSAMSGSNGVMKHENNIVEDEDRVLRQPEIIRIRLYKWGELPACHDRLVEVVSDGTTLYSTCHAFNQMRDQFKKEFRCSKMPGVTDGYEKKVRTRFDLNEFVKTAWSFQRDWISQRLPSGFILPSRPATSPLTIQ